MDKEVKNKVTKLIISFIVFSIILSLIYFIYYLYTHGILLIKTDNTISKLELINKKDLVGSNINKPSKSHHLAPGDYLVKLYFDNGHSYSKEITVGNFLKTTIVEPTNIDLTYNLDLEVSYGDFCQLSKTDYLTYSSSGETYVFADPNIINEFRKKTVIKCKDLGSIKHIVVNNLDKIDFYTYDNSTLKKRYSVDTHSKPINIYEDNNTLYTAIGNELFLFGEDKAHSYKLPQEHLAKIYDVPIISKNKDYLAFINGNDYYHLNSENYEDEEYRRHGVEAEEYEESNHHSHHTHEHKHEQDSVESKIGIAKLDGDRYVLDKYIKLNASFSDIIGIQISPNSQYLSVIRDNFIHIYDLAEGIQKILLQSTSAQWQSFSWINDKEAIYIGSDSTIQKVNMETLETFSIVSSKDLRVTSILRYQNGKLYFSGFPKNNTDQNSSLPSGFSISI